MDYIDRHLGDPLPLDHLAEIAAFSKYHFHRIFFAMRGETPGQFIQRLRLERAARLLLGNRDLSVTEIAFDSGFHDAAAFSRAFRNAFGTTPSGYREENRNLSMTDRNAGTAPGRAAGYDAGTTFERRNEMPELQMKPIPAQSVSVVDKPEMTVAYVRHTGPYMGDEQLFQRLFATLYKWAGPRNLVRRGVTEELIIYHDDPETVEAENQRVSCCISVPPETPVEGEIGKMTVDAGTYAEARFKVDATQFGGAWNWVYGVWLPESGYQPDDRFCYERYQDHEPEQEMDGAEGRTFVVDICVPVKPL